MTRRTRLLTSIPYWLLVAGSVAASAAGVLVTLDKVGAMTSTLLDGTATGVEVYAGQAWVVVGGALITAGLVGLALALALAAARALVPASDTRIEPDAPVAAEGAGDLTPEESNDLDDDRVEPLAEETGQTDQADQDPSVETTRPS